MSCTSQHHYLRDKQVLINSHFPGQNWVKRYQNVSILDFNGTKDEGGGRQQLYPSYKTCKAPVK